MLISINLFPHIVRDNIFDNLDITTLLFLRDIIPSQNKTILQHINYKRQIEAGILRDLSDLLYDRFIDAIHHTYDRSIKTDETSYNDEITRIACRATIYGMFDFWKIKNKGAILTTYKKLNAKYNYQTDCSYYLNNDLFGQFIEQGNQYIGVEIYGFWDHAVREGHDRAIRRMIEGGHVSIDFINRLVFLDEFNDVSVLEKFMTDKNISMVSFLIEIPGIDLNRGAIIAFIDDDVRMFRLYGSKKDQMSRMLILEALSYYQAVNIIKEMHFNGWDLDSYVEPDRKGKNSESWYTYYQCIPIDMAICFSQENIDIVRFMLECGYKADLGKYIYPKDPIKNDNYTLLSYVLSFGNHELIRLLLKYYPEHANQLFCGMSLVSYACTLHTPNNCSSDPYNRRSKEYGYECPCGCDDSKYECDKMLGSIEVLMNARCSINQVDLNGDTALHHAVCSCLNNEKCIAYKVVKRLVRCSDIDLSIKNNEGKTALDIAMETKNSMVIRSLNID